MKSATRWEQGCGDHGDEDGIMGWISGLAPVPLTWESSSWSHQQNQALVLPLPTPAHNIWANVLANTHVSIHPHAQMLPVAAALD